MWQRTSATLCMCLRFDCYLHMQATSYCHWQSISFEEAAAIKTAVDDISFSFEDIHIRNISEWMELINIFIEYIISDIVECECTEMIESIHSFIPFLCSVLGDFCRRCLARGDVTVSRDPGRDRPPTIGTNADASMTRVRPNRRWPGKRYSHHQPIYHITPSINAQSYRIALGFCSTAHLRVQRWPYSRTWSISSEYRTSSVALSPILINHSLDWRRRAEACERMRHEQFIVVPFYGFTVICSYEIFITNCGMTRTYTKKHV